MQETLHFLARRDVPDAPISIKTTGGQVATIRAEVESPRQRGMLETLHFGSGVRVPDMSDRARAARQVTAVRAECNRNDAVRVIQPVILPGLCHLPGSHHAIGTARRDVRSIWTEVDLEDHIVETHRHPHYLLAVVERPDTRGPVVTRRRDSCAVRTPGEALRRVIQRELNDVSRTWRSEEHTSELQSRGHLVCRLL